MTVRFRRSFRVSRRLGLDIWGISKDPVHKKNYRPGVHGQSSIRKSSDYGKQLGAQLAIRTHYCMKQYQLKSFYIKASKTKENTIDSLAGALESRLSAILFRSNLYPTMRSAHLAVSHKHILVDGKYVMSASYIVKPGSKIEIIEKQKNNQNVLQAIKNTNVVNVDYLDVDKESRKVVYLRVPYYSEVPYSFQANMNLVIEFFSKMV